MNGYTTALSPRRRNSLRLHGWDYAENGYYFVTLVTQGRELVFENAKIRGVVEMCWRWLAQRHSHVELDTFVVMPNHLHGIIILRRDAAGGSRTTPTQKPLGRLIGAFKTVSTQAVNAARHANGTPLWQRGYHDRIIRDESELDAIREYIRDNPAKWNLDPNNPSLVDAR